MPILTALCAAGFAAIHLFVGRLRFLDVIPRSRWLSFAGGVAVGYIFLHVLPELAEHRQRLAEQDLATPRAGHAVYLVALGGLASFYGLERAVRTSRGRQRERAARIEPDPRVFWIHVASFAVYNALIGYLLLNREESGLWSLALFGSAMALHFLTNDFGLRQDYAKAYDSIARWIIAGAVVLGWAVGLTIEVPPAAVSILFSFLAGGVVLNVLKEELPEERQSRFWPFALGAAVFSLLVLIA